ncbi:MAG: RsmE family RNA methyltransferase [Kofleriaceae bacterium]
MNLVLLEAEEVAEALGGRGEGALAPPLRFELELGDRRARHLLEVVRVTVGALVRVGLVDVALGSAEVLAVATGRCRLAVTLERAAPPPAPVHLILAVPRPKVLRRAVAIASSFGVARIDLTNAWRVDKSYLGSPALSEASLARAARDGAEQGALGRVPAIDVHRRLMGLIDGLIDGRIDERTDRPNSGSSGERAAPTPPPLRVIAHPKAARSLEHVVVPGARQPVILAIGPEGGWIAREVETFEARGFAAVTLGESILRVEAAVAGALAQLELLRRL